MAYTQLTRAQLRSLFDDRLGAAASTFWLDDEKNGIIQEAMRVFNSITGFWKTSTSITTVADEHWYTLGGLITSGMRVRFNGKPLAPVTLADLDTGQRYWESETTISGGVVPTTPKMWCIGGINLVAIWPADHDGSNALMVDGIASTPTFVSDTSYVDIGKEELNTLLDYMEHIALFKEGGVEFEASMPLFQSFLSGAVTRNAMLMANAPYRKWLGLDDNKRPMQSSRKGMGAR